MTDLPPRRRGRPTKAEAEARAAAAQDAAKKSQEETSFLDSKLAEPVGKRRTKLQPDDDTLRLIGELAKLFCTQEEIAGILGVTKRTLTNFLGAYPEAHDAWEDGIQHAKVSLRRKQLALADKNAPAAIFLGKNYLGQKDENHTNLNISKPAVEMTEDELLEIASKAAKQPAAPAKKESVH